MNQADALKAYIRVNEKEAITPKNANTFVQGAEAAINALNKKIDKEPEGSKYRQHLEKLKAAQENIRDEAMSVLVGACLNDALKGLEPEAVTNDGKKVKRL